MNRVGEYGYCGDLATALGIDHRCCDSCHDDIEYGFELIEEEYNGRDYQVCCWMSDSLDNRKAGRA